ncbi:MAG: phosphoribosylformylglycinamidine synthase [Firmicutes bacterium]|nr:phosphoribosylformylglycinamidine synthase [Bacillota bacterium]
MVYRVFVEKKEEFANEARNLFYEIKELLQIPELSGLRILNRYDVEGLPEEEFHAAINTVFSEPQVDKTYLEYEAKEGETVFAVEYLPGQFDQRAESAAECLQLLHKSKRPLVKSAKFYILKGELKPQHIKAIKKYVINPVEAREASIATYGTLKQEYSIPTSVEHIKHFDTLDEKGLKDFIETRGLAMDINDIKMVQEYFESEKRQPTITEIKVIDTYWSDHCRHTTFNTTIDSIKFSDKHVEATYKEYLKTRDYLDRKKPVSLMDIGTIAAKYLKKEGLLTKLDESEEINACTVKIDVNIDGKIEPWLLLFKNETHNHPTEIEPFGGAATCIGGAIRDPLSGRSYVYSAMRLTGAGDPLVPVNETLPGKLPQRKIVTTAAAGYSSYGNQIGLATCQVDELYHPGYVAKRMEIGAVIAATPEENVKRMTPEPGDVVILLGGKTGRDGCGGATGSSKAHTEESLETCGAEVQKGNAPEERKLQRLFRNPEASKMIKRCNDFGAGGVSVAIGELAAGLSVNLNMVPKKYEGLDGTELAISESQERMAVVVSSDDVARFSEIASSENLEATPVAEVTEEPRLKLFWNDKCIVDLSREFLDTNGAEKHISAEIPKGEVFESDLKGSLKERLLNIAEDLNCCSKRGLSERFDSTIGAGTVLMPFGGKYQRTPIQAMANLISVEEGHTNTCSLMSWGFNPYVSEKDPYRGAYLAVVESVSKLIATGSSFNDIYLTFQEYFERLGTDGVKWGKPLAAVLGAYKAQMELGIAAIGGKDSMSGSFEDLNVPPTLVSFAVTTTNAENIKSPEFKNAGNNVVLIKPIYDADTGLPSGKSLKAVYDKVSELMQAKKALSAYTPGFGGVAEGVMKMCMGNGISFKFNSEINPDDIFKSRYGSFILEVTDAAQTKFNQDEDYRAFLKGQGIDAVLLGETDDSGYISFLDEQVALEEIIDAYESKLESVYSCNIKTEEIDKTEFTFNDAGSKDNNLSFNVNTGKGPSVLIPVFPGTNCEYDSAKAFRDAGANTEIFIIKNLSQEDVIKSVEDFAAAIKRSEIIFIPGGFSAGDEPDGSGKFITSFFRNDEIKEAVSDLLDERKGLMAGICNGFQALIKLGLVPYGKIMDMDANCPTLTFNEIGRHQSKLVRTRIASNMSPWLADTMPGEIYTVPISHGEGRFIARPELIAEMAKNGQIATQYVDLEGNITNNIQFNPNGSYNAIEGITSPDGRIFGKMGHSERIGEHLYKNVPGNFDIGMFRSAVKYFK